MVQYAGYIKKFPKTFYVAILRGATGAARAPNLDKTPNMAARWRCRRCFLFSKIKVRPRSCRSYPIWRPCLEDQKDDQIQISTI